MLLLFPYSVDLSIHRWPVANFCILGGIQLAFLAEVAMPEDQLPSLVLTGWTLSGILGHMWLHTSELHVIGNGIFLWAFGNAVCAKVGSTRFLASYLGFGIAAALAHLIADGSPAVGASGAINGVVGMYLAFFPTNDVSCFYMVIFRAGTVTVSGFWIILADECKSTGICSHRAASQGWMMMLPRASGCAGSLYRLFAPQEKIFSPNPSAATGASDESQASTSNLHAVAPLITPSPRKTARGSPVTTSHSSEELLKLRSPALN